MTTANPGRPPATAPADLGRPPDITAATAEPVVHVGLRGAVAVLTLDHPPTRNGLGPRLRELLMAAFDQAMRDPAVRAVVVTGAGGNFSAGSDLTAVAAQDTPGRVERMALFQRFVLGWRDAPKPVVVAIEGSAAGGGLSMALAADWAVAARDAVFVPGWMRIALVPDVACVWLLTRVLGEKRAWDWLVRGGRMSGDTAATNGIVTTAVEPGAALPEALRLAEAAAALPTHALTATKRLFRLAMSSHPNDFLLGELYTEAYLFDTADHREGVASFLGKREPRWQP